MSRSNYSDDYEAWDLIRWRGAVKSAIRGKRGQAMLRELADALDAMPARELVSNTLEADGQYCALGVLGAKRGIQLNALDTYDTPVLADAFGVSDALVREVMFINDDWGRRSTPAQRWQIVRDWVQDQLR